VSAAGPSFWAIKARILDRMAGRRRVGPFDWCGDSWDSRVASARALRIVCRLRGQRITLRDALRD